MIIEMTPMISITKSQFEERLKEVEIETAKKVVDDLITDVENHSIYWSYQNRANIIDRLTKFKERYMQENSCDH